MTTREILGRHDKFLDSLIDGFEEKLDPLVAAARKRTLQALEKKLTIENGVVAVTPGNQRALRSIDRIFRTEMNRSTKKAPGGYKALAKAFSSQFADHLPKFQDVLNQVVESAGGEKLPQVNFTGADVDLFASQAVGAKDMLEDVLDQTSNAAKRQALFSVGGLKFTDLADVVEEQFEETAASAVTIADTSVSMFYRTIASHSYKKIEQGLKPGAARYEYAGPDDSLTRPFCDEMLTRTKKEPMTRQEIEGQRNGQIANPFVSGGGFNCRHQWVIAEGLK